MKQPQISQGYSLTALFLLVTTAALVLGLASSTDGRAISRVDDIVVAQIVLGAMFGGGVGCAAAAAYPRRGRSLLIGLFTGAGTGGVCAFSAAAGASIWLYLAGAAGLLLLGAISLILQNKVAAQHSRETAATEPLP